MLHRAEDTKAWCSLQYLRQGSEPKASLEVGAQLSIVLHKRTLVSHACESFQSLDALLSAVNIPVRASWVFTAVFLLP